MIAREGIPFILSFLILSGLLLWLAIRFDSRWLLSFGALSTVLFCIVLFFFRDPERSIPEDEGVYVSPADGRIMSIDTLAQHPFVGAQAQRIVIFLSPFDVHINRYPSNGQVKDIQYAAGKFLPAYADGIDSVNERNEISIQTPHGPVAVIQIAGFLARRIVCRAQSGDKATRGERYGMIKFSSRTDLVLPQNAKVMVTPGMKVRGGETILAQAQGGTQ